jgi:activator of 2-hydroxyglutaryl-CoA dehydratase
MGRKKIRNPYDGRKHVVTVRLKYWEHQELTAMASKLDKSVSDMCRMFMNQAIVEDAKDAAKPEMIGRSPGF